MIGAGKLNKRVVIQHQVAGSPLQNSYGELNHVWETYATVWASIEPIQGREFWAQQQVQSEVSVRIRIRYLAGVTSDMRVQFGARIFSIEGVIEPKEQHREIQLMCSEGLNNG